MTLPSASAASAVAGFGFRAEATVASLRSALQAACARSESATAKPPPVITALATAQDKATHPALIELARELALPVIAVPLAELTQSQVEAALSAPPGAVSGLTASSRIPARYGSRSLAESSALAAAGQCAHLLAPRAVSADKMATASIAAVAILQPTHVHP